MDFRPRRRDLRVEISMINLIDVMFNVVVFLLLTTTFRQEVSGLEIRLPKSSSKMERAQEDLVVAVTADGVAHFRGREITPELLASELRETFRTRPDKNVIVQGDEKAPHGRMMGVYDAIRGAGGTGISVAALPPGAGR